MKGQINHTEPQKVPGADTYKIRKSTKSFVDMVAKMKLSGLLNVCAQ